MNGMFQPRRVWVAGSNTLLGRALVRQIARMPEIGIVDCVDEMDFGDAAAVDRFVAATRPDAVIVAAGARAGIGGNARDPAGLMLDNLRVAAHVIPAAWRYGIARLLYVASSCVYPRDAPQPWRVESIGTGPLEPTSAAFATAKLAGMRLCEAYRRQHGARFITCIPADTFGPGDELDPDRAHVVAALVHRFCEAKASGARSVEVWGSGEPRREFLYVDDLADACLFLIRHYDGEAPINVGTGITTSIRELAEKLRAIVGYEGHVHFDATRPDGAPVKWLDSRPLRALGWAPSWDLDAALTATCRAHVEAGSALHEA